LLGRLSSHSLSTDSSLTSFQNRIDQTIGHFYHEMTNVQALASIAAGSFFYRLGRLATLSLASRSSLLAPAIDVSSYAVGLSSEVVAYEGVNRLFARASGNSAALQTPFWEGVRSSFVNFSTLKSLSHLGAHQNFFIRNLMADLGMVAGHELTHQLGLTPQQEGSFLERMVEAQITNFQLGMGMSLVARIAPRLGVFERSLELSLSSSRSTFDFDLISRGLTLSSERTFASSAGEVREADLFNQPLLMANDSGSGDKRSRNVTLPPTSSSPKLEGSRPRDPSTAATTRTTIDALYPNVPRFSNPVELFVNVDKSLKEGAQRVRYAGGEWREGYNDAIVERLRHLASFEGKTHFEIILEATRQKIVFSRGEGKNIHFKTQSIDEGIDASSDRTTKRMAPLTEVTAERMLARASQPHIVLDKRNLDEGLRQFKELLILPDQARQTQHPSIQLKTRIQEEDLAAFARVLNDHPLSLGYKITLLWNDGGGGRVSFSSRGDRLIAEWLQGRSSKTYDFVPSDSITRDLVPVLSQRITSHGVMRRDAYEKQMRED
ncbi:MAG: hypothetical protein JNK65_04290, partial [Deltaproteobacteria bacterium]|nr:hypothetical protein [Deltaproteobacteria bacterium]